MLTGNALLIKVNEMQAQEPPAKMSEIVRACGYEHDGKLQYTSFYTELMTVKGLINNDTLEDEISEEYQEQYQKLCNTYGVDAVNAFLELYREEDLEHFDEAYCGRHDSEEDFAEDYAVNVLGVDIPSLIVIDWEATWNCNLRHEFDYEDGFVFSNNW